MIYITQATQEHVRAMSGRIRQADIDEFEAGYSLTPEKAMKVGIMVSTHCWTGICDGRPVAMAGLFPVSFIGDTARPWMVGTRDLERPEVRRQFLLLSKSVLRYMASLYPNLENHVDARNKLAIRWLKWLGFTMHDPSPHGPLGMPFCHFELRSAHV